jgi:multidrug resistance efflux pump
MERHTTGDEEGKEYTMSPCHRVSATNSMMKRILLSVATLLGVLFLAACGNPFATTAQATPAPSATAEAVQAGDQITVDGRVVPVRSADLIFAATGMVSDVLVAEEDAVESGALLARLDDTQQQAAVAQAEANVARAEAVLNQLEARPYPEEIAAAEAARAEAISNRTRAENNDGTDEELDAANAAVTQAQTQLNALRDAPRAEDVAAAQAEIDAAHAALNQAQAALKTTELRAPFAGTVASLNIAPGEVFAPSAPNEPAVRLADWSRWLIETEDLTELSVVNIRQGDAATVRVDAVLDLELRGSVERIASYGENQQGDIVYQVVIALDQTDERLRWNMTAAVTIDLTVTR